MRLRGEVTEIWIEVSVVELETKTAGSIGQLVAGMWLEKREPESVAP